MLGQTLARIFADGTAQLSREIHDAVNQGKGGGEEGWRLRKDGSRLWAVGELSPIRDRSRIIGFVKILRDRIAQREVEEEIREERKTLEILNRAGSALSSETDLQRLVQIVTDAGVELTGAEFGAFFYNVINDVGESYALHAFRCADGSILEISDVAQYRSILAICCANRAGGRSDNRRLRKRRHKVALPVRHPAAPVPPGSTSVALAKNTAN